MTDDKLKPDAWAGLEAFQMWLEDALDDFEGEQRECLEEWLRYGLSVSDQGGYWFCR